MSSNERRSVLSSMPRPSLNQTVVPVAPEAEQALLGGRSSETVVPVSSVESKTRGKIPTVPVTFHLPIEMRDRLKVTAQIKNTTMLELAREAFRRFLDENPVSEADIRRALGL